MTDREYLEMAAKAAGMTLGAWSERRLAFMYRDASPGPGYWNPLADSGQALELAVKLGLHLSQQLSYVAVMQPHGGAGSHLLQWIEQYNNDPLAATRRAIVRAAATIGKGTKPFPTAKEIREEWT